MVGFGRPGTTIGTAPGREQDTPIDSRELAAYVAQLAHAKKAEDVRVFDVAERFRIADYFVLITGLSRPHVKALFNELHVRLKALGQTHSRPEGSDLGWWVLMDFSDVVVHIMQPEARAYYELDRLYGECPELDWASVEVPSGTVGRAAEV